jgi:hypothetical protein
MAKSNVNESSTQIGPDGTVSHASSSHAVHQHSVASAVETTSPSPVLVKSLREAAQGHVLDFWDELSAEDKAALEADVSILGASCCLEAFVQPPPLAVLLQCVCVRACVCVTQRRGEVRDTYDGASVLMSNYLQRDPDLTHSPTNTLATPGVCC